MAEIEQAGDTPVVLPRSCATAPARRGSRFGRGTVALALAIVATLASACASDVPPPTPAVSSPASAMPTPTPGPSATEPTPSDDAETAGPPPLAVPVALQLSFVQPLVPESAFYPGFSRATSAMAGVAVLGAVEVVNGFNDFFARD